MHRRGFTFVEVMLVVVIVAVLATLGVYAIRKYVASAQASEASAVLNSIRAAQEVYRQDTFVYLDVSEGDFDNMHPTDSPGNFKTSWQVSSETDTSRNFRELGVVVDAPVAFGYAVVAGRAGEEFPEPPTDKKDFGFPDDAVDPFYIAVAKGDLDGDGVLSWVLVHSLTNEVYVENEGE
jgi:prepilin-type N-terminal cleavage/methylation domain-containing protein